MLLTVPWSRPVTSRRHLETTPCARVRAGALAVTRSIPSATGTRRVSYATTGAINGKETTSGVQIEATVDAKNKKTGFRPLKVQFISDAEVVSAGRVQVANFGKLTFTYGKKLTINPSRTLDVDTVRFFDGVWRVSEKEEPGAVFRMSHVRSDLTGTVELPNSAEKVKLSGNIQGYSVTFRLRAESEDGKTTLTALLLASEDYKRMRGTAILVVSSDGDETSLGHQVTLNVDEKRKRILFKTAVRAK